MLPLQSAVSPTLRWPAGHAVDAVATVLEVVSASGMVVFTADVEALASIVEVVSTLVMPAVVEGALHVHL